ncbi:MAG TPA: hypothetical protein VLK65_01990, partial [Vicinamibacteria bacterium]|nr:hypothetical protein [Vicinamibacteria bacterium]
MVTMLTLTFWVPLSRVADGVASPTVVPVNVVDAMPFVIGAVAGNTFPKGPAVKVTTSPSRAAEGAPGTGAPLEFSVTSAVSVEVASCAIT